MRFAFSLASIPFLFFRFLSDRRRVASSAFWFYASLSLSSSLEKREKDHPGKKFSILRLFYFL